MHTHTQRQIAFFSFLLDTIISHSHGVFADEGEIFIFYIPIPFRSVLELSIAPVGIHPPRSHDHTHKNRDSGNNVLENERFEKKSIAITHPTAAF